MPTNRSTTTLVDVKLSFASAMAEIGLDLHRSYLTALSGGADSSALTLLMQQYANATGKTHHAVIIDHGLRDHSYAEACRVQDRICSYGVTSDVISIEGPRPTSGLQEWARSHRHRILMSVARDRQAVLLFAHHADDQAETIAMRLLKGSGLVGLSGIPSIRSQHGVIISRPLLGWSRDQLLNVCRNFDYAFENDPSNRDRKFERVRIRQLLANLDQRDEGPSSDQFRRLGVLSAKLTTAAMNANASLLDKAVEWHAGGFATMVMSHLFYLPKFRWAMIMRRVVMAISGNGYAPSAAAIDQLRKRIYQGLSATIGGCHFSPVHPRRDHSCDESEKLFVYRLFRETGRHISAIPVIAGDEVVFAGCWLVKSQQAGTLQACADAGKPGNVFDPAIIRKNMPENWHFMPSKARQAIPVLTTLDGRLIYPQIKEYDTTRSDHQLTAQHLGMAKNSVLVGNTPTNVSC